MKPKKTKIIFKAKKTNLGLVKFSEIARRLGLSETEVKYIYGRALKKIRKCDKIDDLYELIRKNSYDIL